jgi:hypothetical protein
MKARKAEGGDEIAEGRKRRDSQGSRSISLSVCVRVVKVEIEKGGFIFFIELQI